MKADFDRIYFYHIRKAGGQSIYNAILEAICGADSKWVEQWLARTHAVFLLEKKQFITAWEAGAINRQDFYFAFSHHPQHVLFPFDSDTFTFTCLRNPIDRVISHYRMLKGFQEAGERQAVLKLEGDWLGESFDEFIDNIPPHHLTNQLYMFSADYDPEEAFDNVLGLSYHFFLEDYEKGLAGLGGRLGMNLAPKHIMPSTYEFEPSDTELDKLYGLLEHEIRFYDALWKVRDL